MKHKIILLYAWFIRASLYFVPDLPLTMRIRGFLYGLAMHKCGKDFQVANNVILKNLSNISIGNNVFIGNNSILMGGGTISIQDEVLIGPNVVIISGNHTRRGFSYRYGRPDTGMIEIEGGCWITSNCTIAKDSKLPRGSILAANSFLNKKHEIENAIYGGIPAKLIKHD